MKNLNKKLIVTIITSILLISSIYVGTMMSMTLPIQFLHADGTLIKNESGQSVMLRGIATRWNRYNYDYSTDGPMEMEWREALQWMKDNGYTASRVHFNFNDPQYTIDRLEQVVDLFEEYEIYMVMTCGYGAGGDISMEEHYYDGTWIAGWQEVVIRFKDRPIIAAFELANEGAWSEGDNYEKCRNAYKECIEMIRQFDQKHMLIVYEQVRSLSTAMHDLNGVSWLQNSMIWTPDTMPADNNIAFKMGYHWTVIRPVNNIPNTYYDDKFDIAESYGSSYVECVLGLRELYDIPILNFEFGDYDDNSNHANYAGWKNVITLCEENNIHWNYHWLEHWSQYYPTTWKTRVPEFMGTYTNPYMDTMQSFKPEPFNLFDKIIDYNLPWSTADCGLINLADGNYYITLEGPCAVRVRGFSGYPDQRSLTNMVEDKVISIASGETLTLEGGSLVYLVTPYDEYDAPGTVPDNPDDDNIPNDNSTIPDDNTEPDDNTTPSEFDILNNELFMYVISAGLCFSIVYIAVKRKEKKSK